MKTKRSPVQRKAFLRKCVALFVAGILVLSTVGALILQTTAMI